MTGASTGALLLGACGGGGGAAAVSTTASGSSAVSHPTTAAPLSSQMTALQAFLTANASPTYSLPAAPAAIPSITWAGSLSNGGVPATTLSNGQIFAVSSRGFGGPVRTLYKANLPGSPTVAGYPCELVSRPYICKGVPQTTSSATVLRFQTDAPVFELTGVVADGSFTVQTLIVDGALVPPKALSSSLGLGGGWNTATVRVAFGSRQVRDIWIETGLAVAYLKLGESDSFLSVDDAADPQITFVGDSYLQQRSVHFGNEGAIALEAGARLGIRKVAFDSIGGTGYWNSGDSLGNLNDRLSGTVLDNSTIYVVMAGLNDYGDAVSSNSLVWPTTAVYEQAVLGYLQGLRTAQPNALIVVTAPFCPNPTLSDSSYVSHAATNTSGLGDFLFKAQVHKTSIQQVAGPWVYIDVLMGGGWLNSAGATGDVSNLQWLTGGTPAPGTTATNKPGNTLGGAGGAFGGIASVPVSGAGKYSQAPEVVATGGTGSGVLLCATINSAGGLSAINVIEPGTGYTAGSGLPTITIDPTFQISAGSAGTPSLIAPVNPNGEYPLPSFAPAGSAGSLDNIPVLLNEDTVHPSPAGVDYLSSRLAQNVYEAVMAL